MGTARRAPANKEDRQGGIPNEKALEETSCILGKNIGISEKNMVLF
jgi:hypothetical protein